MRNSELATSKLKNKAPGDSGTCPQAWKSLSDNTVTYEVLKSIIIHMWTTEEVPEEWNIGRLTIIPKKGDLSWPKNYHGIMLLEVAYKIIAILLHSRLLPIQEGLDHEPQCGFRPGRGCTDAIYTVKIALKKRREHGLESWVFFLDLVKAFDRVPRELLWMILAKVISCEEFLMNIISNQRLLQKKHYAKSYLIQKTNSLKKRKATLFTKFLATIVKQSTSAK